MKSEKINENQLLYTNNSIAAPIIIGVVFAIAGSFMAYNGFLGDWRGGEEETMLFGLGLLFLVGGVLTVILGPRTHSYLFDKAENEIHYECKKMTGNINDTFSMEGMKRIVITRQRGKSGSSNSSSGGKKKITFKYLLEYEQGDNIELGQINKSFNRSMLASNTPEPEAIKELSAFLDIPVESVGFKETFEYMKNTIKDIISAERSEREKS
jgi:hypothetical protein